MTSKASSRTDVHEGPDAARRFEETMGQVLRVPKDELAKREAAYQAARHSKKPRTPSPSAR